MKTIINIVLILLLIGCKTEHCDTNKIQFSSYDEARISIRSQGGYAIQENRNLNSSWIANAQYYSCDGKLGFLILETHSGKAYTHQNVPLSIWNNFKNARSPGSSYTKNIKGRYRLKFNSL